MGLNFPQAKYSGSKQDDDPHMPTSGSPQPLLDTSNYASSPGVHFGTQPTGNRDKDEDPQMPTGGTIPTSSSDVAQQDIMGTPVNATDSSIYKGSKSNG